MTKEELNRYFWLEHEIKAQSKRLEKIERKISKEPIVTDVVSGSTTEFPYIQTKVKVTGTPEAWVSMAHKMQTDISKSLTEAMQRRTEIECFIQKVEDPQLRELLRSRFIDCLPWDKVGEENFINKDHARKKIREYLKKLPKE